MPPMSAFWDRATPVQKAAAPGLIEKHLAWAAKEARFRQVSFLGEDVERRIMTAVYKAAYSYQPGRGSFRLWLEWQIRGETSDLRRRRRYHESIGVHRVAVRWADVDERYFYRDKA